MIMLDRLVVTPARLAAAAARITSAGRAIDDALTQLESDATALRGSWSGEAQQAFDAAQRQLRARLADRTDALARIDAALTALAESYSATDLQGARSLGATS
ncbi:hypothetical protein RR49_02450 [Microbacterium ginsengisoli]|jgi:early secretory antigenic target protein ESAT-6|uniref:ESAT-6-like protein n=2 Tax=Microbacterium ginsengisoli TaxID=400772 RepID=A0A0F0LV01_9MICO|nr:hypothetical protein RR49_02450 [Microbacterium ginsengisoli]MBN9208753.1 WXG100 family type VII secretion target [Microbacterium ginsengisoli]